MNYALGYACTPKHLYENFDLKKVKFKSNEHRRIVAEKIFRESVNIIFDDIINNNVTFRLPTGKVYSDIHVLSDHKLDFINARKNGKWLDVDFLKSNFTGNKMVLHTEGKGRATVKEIYVGKDLKKRLTELTNEGKLYC